MGANESAPLDKTRTSSKRKRSLSAPSLNSGEDSQTDVATDTSNPGGAGITDQQTESVPTTPRPSSRRVVDSGLQSVRSSVYSSCSEFTEVTRMASSLRSSTTTMTSSRSLLTSSSSTTIQSDNISEIAVAPLATVSSETDLQEDIPGNTLDQSIAVAPLATVSSDTDLDKDVPGNTLYLSIAVAPLATVSSETDLQEDIPGNTLDQSIAVAPLATVSSDTDLDKDVPGNTLDQSIAVVAPLAMVSSETDLDKNVQESTLDLSGAVAQLAIGSSEKDVRLGIPEISVHFSAAVAGENNSKTGNISVAGSSISGSGDSPHIELDQSHNDTIQGKEISSDVSGSMAASIPCQTSTVKHQLQQEAAGICDDSHTGSDLEEFPESIHNKLHDNEQEKPETCDVSDESIVASESCKEIPKLLASPNHRKECVMESVSFENEVILSDGIDIPLPESSDSDRAGADTAEIGKFSESLLKKLETLHNQSSPSSSLKVLSNFNSAHSSQLPSPPSSIGGSSIGSGATLPSPPSSIDLDEVGVSSRSEDRLRAEPVRCDFSIVIDEPENSESTRDNLKIRPTLGEPAEKNDVENMPPVASESSVARDSGVRVDELKAQPKSGELADMKAVVGTRTEKSQSGVTNAKARDSFRQNLQNDVEVLPPKLEPSLKDSNVSAEETLLSESREIIGIYAESKTQDWDGLPDKLVKLDDPVLIETKSRLNADDLADNEFTENADSKRMGDVTIKLENVENPVSIAIVADSQIMKIENIVEVDIEIRSDVPQIEPQSNNDSAEVAPENVKRESSEVIEVNVLAEVDLEEVRTKAEDIKQLIDSQPDLQLTGLKTDFAVAEIESNTAESRTAGQEVKEIKELIAPEPKVEDLQLTDLITVTGLEAAEGRSDTDEMRITPDVKEIKAFMDPQSELEELNDIESSTEVGSDADGMNVPKVKQIKDLNGQHKPQDVDIERCVAQQPENILPEAIITELNSEVRMDDDKVSLVHESEAGIKSLSSEVRFEDSEPIQAEQLLIGTEPSSKLGLNKVEASHVQKLDGRIEAEVPISESISAMDEPSQDFKPENQAVFVEAASIESKEQTIDKVDPDSENIAEVKLNEIQILGEDLREKNVEQDANVKDTKIVGKGNAESYHDFVDEKENEELNRRENVKTVNKSLAATIGEYEEVTNDDIDDLENVLEELEVFVEDGETKQVDYVVNVASKKANKFEVVKKTSSKIDRKIGKFFHRKSESQIVIKSTESSEKASKSAAPMSWLKKKLRSRSMSLGSLKRKSKKPEPLASSTDGVGDTNWFVVGAGAVEKSFDEATAKESDREAEVESRDVSETVESVDENLRHAGVVEDVSESKNVAREFVSQDVSKNVEKDFIHREVEDTENEESARTFTSRDVSETVVEDAIDFDSARRKPYEDLDGLEDVFDGADALGDVDARCESAELERILTRRPAGDEMSSSFGEVAIKRVKRRSSADIESLSKNAEVLSRRRSFSGSKTVSSVLSPDFVDISWKKGAEIVASKTTDENVIENAEIVANKITDENVIENAEIVASKITDENLIENAEIFASKTADGNSGVDVVEVKNAERVPRESAAGVEVEAFAVELKSSLETQPVVEESSLPSVRSPESTFPNVVAAEKTCNDFIASETRRNNENEVDRLEKHSESNVLLEGKITLSKHLETDDAEAGRNSKSADAQIEVVMAPIIEVTPEVGADRVIAKSTPQCSKSVGVTAHEVTSESKIGADRTQLNEIGVMSLAQLVEPAAEGAEFDSPEVIAPATLESSSTRYVEKEGERTAQSEVELVANFIEEDVTPKGSDLPETRFSDRMTHDTSRAGNLQEPGIEEPGIEEPGFQEPGEQELGMQEPGKQKPGLEKPGLQELSVHGLTDIDRRPFDVRSADSNEKTESSTSDIRVEDRLNADRLNADRLNAISKNEMREFSEINDEFRNGLKSVDIGVDYELVAAAAAAVDVGDRDQSSNSSSSEEDTHIPGPDYDRYAEQRLAAKRAARAEAREIRMKEIEKQQKEEDAKEGSVPATGAGYEGKEHRPSAGSLRQLSTTSYSNSRRSSEDSIENDMAIHIRRRGMSNLQIQEAEEKYKKAMMNNAQLDNEKQLLKYQVDLLRDQIDDFEETITELNRQYRDKSSELEFQKRSYRELERNNEFLKEHIRQRDALIEEHGLVLIGTEGDTPVNNGATLLSHDTLQLLDKYGDGELDGSRPPKLIGADDKLRKLVDEKQSLDQEIRDLRKELDGYKAKEIVDEKYGTSSTKTNGPDIDVIQTEEEMRETSRQISDYKFKLQKSEQEVSILEASVNRLESQVKRYKAAAEGAEKLEEELKTEKRRIARELREAQSTNEELQTQNSHLQKRLEKLKSSRNALLK